MKETENNQMVPLGLLKTKLGVDFNFCENCPNITLIGDGQPYCTDKKCRATRKRLATKKRNIINRTRWREVEMKLLQNQENNRHILDDPIFPYILIEMIIEHMAPYDDQLKTIISVKLDIPKSKIKKEGPRKIHKLPTEEVKRLAELLVLRSIGLERAEHIVNEKGRE